MNASPDHGLPHGSPHEPTSLNVRALVIALAGLALLLAFAFASMWIFQSALAARDADSEGESPIEAFTGPLPRTTSMPKLNPNQRRQRILVLQRQLDRLQGSSPPSDNGFAQIPIDRAMQLTVQRYQQEQQP